VELTQLLRRYWPVFLVAMVGGFLGYRWMPEGSARSRGVPGALLDPIVPSSPAKADAAPASSAPSAVGGKQLGEVPNAGSLAAAPQFEIREVLLAVAVDEPAESKLRTLTQDSPEVKTALSQLKIEIYRQGEAQDAQEVEKFLTHNNLPFAVRDMKDAMERERARRLSGQAQPPEQTLIVIDGQVLSDYSQDALQDLLVSATKKRIQK